MERRPFEVKSPEDWPIRTLFPALIAKLNSVSEGENKCSISSLELFVFRMTLSRGRKCGAKVVLHATWVQHGVTSQPAEAANSGGHMGDKNHAFGDDPEAVN
jgi:hypothetical protein